MIIRTGTSHTGIMFRYYSCSNFLKKGRTACHGRNMRMERLDKLVIEGLEGDLLEPGRLSAMLSQLDGILAERAAAVSRRLAALAREAEDADDRLRHVYKLVEEGRAELDDLLSDRIADLKRARERAHAALERARSATPSTGEADSPIAIERFTRAMRERLTGGTIQFRRAYLGSLIGRIEVDDREVRISARNKHLSRPSWPPDRARTGFLEPYRSGVPGRARTCDPQLRRLRYHSKTPRYLLTFCDLCCILCCL